MYIKNIFLKISSILIIITFWISAYWFAFIEDKGLIFLITGMLIWDFKKMKQNKELGIEFWWWDFPGFNNKRRGK